MIVPPWPCRALNQLAGQRIHLIGIQRPEQRPETADQRVQVQRRRGAGQRDRVARLELLGAAGTLLQRQVAAADQVVVADDGPAALGQHHRVVGGELDQRRRIGLNRNLFHLADLDTGDADEVVVLQPGHVGELGPVGVGLLAEAQLPEHREQRRTRRAGTQPGRRPRRTDGASQVVISWLVTSHGRRLSAGWSGRWGGLRGSGIGRQWCRLHLRGRGTTNGSEPGVGPGSRGAIGGGAGGRPGHSGVPSGAYSVAP